YLIVIAAADTDHPSLHDALPISKAPKVSTTPTGVFKFTDFEPRITISDSVAEQGINLPRTPAEIPTPELIINTQTKTKFPVDDRSEEHTSELQSRENLVCRLLLE